MWQKKLIFKILLFGKIFPPKKGICDQFFKNFICVKFCTNKKG